MTIFPGAAPFARASVNLRAMVARRAESEGCADGRRLCRRATNLPVLEVPQPARRVPDAARDRCARSTDIPSPSTRERGLGVGGVRAGKVAHRGGDHRPVEPPAASPAARLTLRRPAHRRHCPTRRCARSAAPDRRDLTGPADLAQPAYRMARPVVAPFAPTCRLSEAPARKRAIELCRRSHLRPKTSHRPHTRTGLAACASAMVIGACVVRRDAVIIADEPTRRSRLAIQGQIITLLKRLCREHRTAVMLVTHGHGRDPPRLPTGGGDVCRPHRRDRPVRDADQRAKHPIRKAEGVRLQSLGADKDNSSRRANGSIAAADEMPRGCGPSHRAAPRFRPLERVETSRADGG